MKAIRWAAAIAAAAFAVGPSAPVSAEPGFALNLDDSRRVLSPVTHGSLTLFPIVLRGEAETRRRYLVLDEGMEAEKVEIHEKEGGGTVNQLTLENRSSEPLFLMAGEVIIGGKQDRIIGKNTVIEPKSSESIPVFCVEHGRWSGRKAEFSTAGSLAHTELRKKASFEGQSAVWKEVKKKNVARKVDNKTDTYRRVARGQEVEKAIRGYERAFARALSRSKQRRRMVGFVVALNGRVVGIESFASPALFRKLEKKLLRSYYVEAVDHPAPKKGVKAPAAGAIEKFQAEAKKAKRRVVLQKERARTLHFESDRIKGSRVEVEGEDKPVYESAHH